MQIYLCSYFFSFYYFFLNALVVVRFIASFSIICDFMWVACCFSHIRLHLHTFTRLHISDIFYYYFQFCQSSISCFDGVTGLADSSQFFGCFADGFVTRSLHFIAHYLFLRTHIYIYTFSPSIFYSYLPCVCFLVMHIYTYMYIYIYRYIKGVAYVQPAK